MKKILVCMSVLMMIPACAFVNLDLKSLMTLEPMEERVLYQGTKDKILVIEILGPITITSMKGMIKPKEGTVERLDAVLKLAAKDKAIKGIIVKIDSPGGWTTASDLTYRKINGFRKARKIPVVACIVGSGTSGAYMVSLASDKIIAHPTSIVGNVGVLIPSLSLEGLMDKLGIKNQTITSGKYKDSGNILRDMTEEDRKILEDLVMEFYRDFIAKVEKDRPVTKEDLEVISDGRVMSASSGLKYHLIDEVGYYEDAVKDVEELAGIKNATIVMYRHKGEKDGGFYSWP